MTSGGPTSVGEVEGLAGALPRDGLRSSGTPSSSATR